MTRKPANHRKEWRPSDVCQLEHLAQQNTPTRVIGLKLQRTPQAIQAKASAERISLKPTNQSPYGPRRKK
jgi:hypothetical protein